MRTAASRFTSPQKSPRVSRKKTGCRSNRGDYGIDVVLRLYVPNLKKFENWEPPKAENL